MRFVKSELEAAWYEYDHAKETGGATEQKRAHVDGLEEYRVKAEAELERVTGEVATIEASCCGMAGAFGYEAEHYDVSMKMAELSLLPTVREADAETLIVADGTSCRHQIADGAGRPARHAALVLAEAISDAIN